MSDTHKEQQRIYTIQGEWKHEHSLTTKGSSERRRLNRILARAEANGWHCELCGKPFKKMREITVDHIVPKSFNGSNDRSNLRVAHRGCNSARGNMPTTFFYMFRVLQNKFPHHVIDAFPGKRRSREDKQKFKASLRQCNPSVNQGKV